MKWPLSGLTNGSANDRDGGAKLNVRYPTTIQFLLLAQPSLRLARGHHWQRGPHALRRERANRPGDVPTRLRNAVLKALADS